MNYRSQDYKREHLYQVQEQLTSKCVEIASQLHAFNNVKNVANTWLDEITTAEVSQNDTLNTLAGSTRVVHQRMEPTFVERASSVLTRKDHDERLRSVAQLS